MYRTMAAACVRVCLFFNRHRASPVYVRARVPVIYWPLNLQSIVNAHQDSSVCRRLCSCVYMCKLSWASFVSLSFHTSSRAKVHWLRRSLVRGTSKPVFTIIIISNESCVRCFAGTTIANCCRWICDDNRRRWWWLCGCGWVWVEVWFMCDVFSSILWSPVASNKCHFLHNRTV